MFGANVLLTNCVWPIYEFRGKDSEIELIPVEEFLKQAPGSIAKHVRKSYIEQQL